MAWKMKGNEVNSAHNDTTDKENEHCPTSTQHTAATVKERLESIDKTGGKEYGVPSNADGSPVVTRDQLIQDQ